jgi:predicted enzyme related to lactoylglutathione lyase
MAKKGSSKTARSKSGKRGTAARRAARPAKAIRRPKPSARARARQAPATSRAKGKAARGGIGLRNHHMDYTSHSMDDVKRFYTELLGFLDFDFDPEVQYLYVRTGPSSSLGFMPPMPGPPEQWRPPREPAIYLEVEDVDRAHRDLVARGVTFQQPPMDMPWDHRVAVLRDPEGRTIALAQKVAISRSRSGR